MDSKIKIRTKSVSKILAQVSKYFEISLIKIRNEKRRTFEKWMQGLRSHLNIDLKINKFLNFQNESR